jgi:signal transduction histidine kinase
MLRQTRGELVEYARTLEHRVAERTANLQMTVRSLEGVCYHIAHDLRAPLRAMQGFTTLLLHHYGRDLDATAEDFAQRISSAATRMDRLIGDLLDFGRLSHVELSFTRINLDARTDAVLTEMTEEIHSRQAEVTVDCPLPQIVGNLTVVHQILTNLIQNALKYVQLGRPPRVHIWARSNETTVRLWVEDNGIGIAPEHHERIFRVFERLDHSGDYPGTGIGLAIVAKGAERMGGKVGVESQLGHGSRFWIEFPRASALPIFSEGRSSSKARPSEV